MFQKFIFTNFNHQIFIGILIVFSLFIPQKLKAQTQPTLFTIWVEEAWLMSFDLMYSGKIQPEIEIRDIALDFTPAYIWKRYFVFICDIPFRFNYKYNAFISPESKKIFILDNIYFGSSYRFEKKDFKNFIVSYNLGFLLPTLNKLSGDDELDIEGERCFGIEPGIAISKVFDPILSNLKFSFLYPMWTKEKDKKDTLRSLNIGTDFYFLINEKFSYITRLDIIIGKEIEKYITSIGIGYFLTSDKELRLSFLNTTSGFANETTINLSLNIRKKRQ